MPKEFIMRGQTASGETETLNMTGYRPSYGYRITEFQLYPSATIIGATYEMSASVTADNTSMDPENPNFSSDGLLATALIIGHPGASSAGGYHLTVINDLYIITQDLILKVEDTQNNPVNWQVRFKEEKLSGAAEAVANYKQYTVYNNSV